MAPTTERFAISAYVASTSVAIDRHLRCRAARLAYVIDEGDDALARSQSAAGRKQRPARPTPWSSSSPSSPGRRGEEVSRTAAALARDHRRTHSSNDDADLPDRRHDASSWTPSCRRRTSATSRGSPARLRPAYLRPHAAPATAPCARPPARSGRPRPPTASSPRRTPAPVQRDRRPDRLVEVSMSAAAAGSTSRARGRRAASRTEIERTVAPSSGGLKAHRPQRLWSGADDGEALGEQGVLVGGRRLKGGTKTSRRARPASASSANAPSSSAAVAMRRGPSARYARRGDAWRVRWSRPCSASVTPSRSIRCSTASLHGRRAGRHAVSPGSSGRRLARGGTAMQYGTPPRSRWCGTARSRRCRSGPARPRPGSAGTHRRGRGSAAARARRRRAPPHAACRASAPQRSRSPSRPGDGGSAGRAAPARTGPARSAAHPEPRAW